MGWEHTCPSRETGSSDLGISMMSGEERLVNWEPNVSGFRDEMGSFRLGPQMVPVMVTAPILVSPCGALGRMYHLMVQNQWVLGQVSCLGTGFS